MGEVWRERGHGLDDGLKCEALRMGYCQRGEVVLRQRREGGG